MSDWNTLAAEIDSQAVEAKETGVPVITSQQMNIQKTIDDYDALVNRCMHAIRVDADKTLGHDMWLQHSILHGDIILDYFDGGRLYFYGTAYTMQTMQHEHFDGSINV